MDISDLAQEFNFVDSVTLERNEIGEINLKMPQHRYEKSNKVPVHQYGWGPFCKFYVDTSNYQGTAGIYIFTANHQIVYVGEAIDIHRRIQSGYSNISPKNCFKGGQQTNCRINNAILETIRNRGQVAIWAVNTADRKKRKKELVEMCDPLWNIESPSTTKQQQIFRANNTASLETSTRSESATNQQPSTDGKYVPLYDHLKNSNKNTIQLSFEQIEEILNAPLPASARKYDVWWNPAGHSHAKGWAELGWTASPDLDREIATFEKIQ